MRLLFDHGTLVLAEPPDLTLDFVPGLLWDPRVALFRAPAYRYADVVDALRSRGVPFSDEVVGAAPTPADAWKSPELRPYQRGALLSWEVAAGQGISGHAHRQREDSRGARGHGERPLPDFMLGADARSPAAVGFGAVCRLWWQHRLLGRREPQRRADHGGDLRKCLPAHAHASGDRFDLLIVDEVHHFGVGVRDEALEMCVAERRLGLTATPPT